MPLIQPYLTLLKINRQYRWLWLSQVISLVGDWFNLIATTTLIAQLSGSGVAISGLFVARMLPPIFLGPVVGVAADRFDRQKILITSDILRLFVVLGFLLVKTRQDLWLLYALVLLQLSISAFFEPTRSALMPGIVARKDLITANALDGVTWSTMLAVGAALGGLATVLLGIQAAFIIDALTFGLSAWFVSRIRPPESEKPVQAAQGGFSSYIEGLRYLWQRKHLLALTMVKAAGSLSYGAMDVVQVNFAEKIFQVGGSASGTLGLIYAVIGIGTGVGPLLAKHFGKETRRAMRGMITFGFILSAAGFFGVAWSPTLPLFLLAILVRTFGSGIGWIYSSALLQMDVPAQYRGRVFALDMAVYTLAATSSTLAAGIAFDGLRLSPREVAFGAALIAVGVTITWQIYHRAYLKR